MNSNNKAATAEVATAVESPVVLANQCRTMKSMHRKAGIYHLSYYYHLTYLRLSCLTDVVSLHAHLLSNSTTMTRTGEAMI